MKCNSFLSDCEAEGIWVNPINHRPSPNLKVARLSARTVDQHSPIYTCTTCRNRSTMYGRYEQQNREGQERLKRMRGLL